MDEARHSDDDDAAARCAREIVRLAQLDQPDARAWAEDLADACTAVVGLPARVRPIGSAASPGDRVIGLSTGGDDAPFAALHVEGLLTGGAPAHVHGTSADLVVDALVAAASAALLRARAEDRAAHLQRALDSRIVVEQAKGMLAERSGSDVDAAFAALRAHARAAQRRLEDIAREIVGRGDAWHAVLDRLAPAAPGAMPNTDPASLDR